MKVSEFMAGSVMSILGHGIDLVEVERIGEMLEAHGQHFLDRVFTAGEQAYCLPNKRKLEHLAGRFAAKEAILKAIGTGWRSGIAWTDMEILADGLGKPTLTLRGQAAVFAQQLGITRWHVSITHIRSHAMASAVAE